MSARLIRALQRGGCTSFLKEDRWAVWRGHDRRMRQIGLLKTDEIESLRALGHLKPLGESAELCFVWSGPMTDRYDQPAAALPDRDTLLDFQTQTHACPLLIRVLKTSQDEALRARLRRAAQVFAMDVEGASGFGAPGGMNWSALQTGGLQKSSGRRPYGHGWRLATLRAQQRLDKLGHELGPRAMAFLHALIIEQKTRHAIQKRFHIKSRVAERRAKRLLKRLIEVQDQLGPS